MELLFDGYCSDVSITLRSKTWKLHKKILALKSGYFAGLLGFQSQNQTSGTADQWELPEGVKNPDILDTLFRCIYGLIDFIHPPTFEEYLELLSYENLLSVSMTECGAHCLPSRQFMISDYHPHLGEVYELRSNDTKFIGTVEQIIQYINNHFDDQIVESMEIKCEKDVGEKPPLHFLKFLVNGKPIDREARSWGIVILDKNIARLVLSID